MFYNWPYLHVHVRGALPGVVVIEGHHPPGAHGLGANTAPAALCTAPQGRGDGGDNY